MMNDLGPKILFAATSLYYLGYLSYLGYFSCFNYFNYFK